jgi:hypothetical protein
VQAKNKEKWREERFEGMSPRLKKARRVIATVAAVAVGVACFFIGMKVLGSGINELKKVIPSGTALTVRLSQPISSDSARLGDVFEARVVSSRGTNGEQVVPAGARVKGRCVAVRPGEGDGRPGYLRLALYGLWDDDGHFFPLETTTYSVSGSWVTNFDREPAGEGMPQNSFTPSQALIPGSGNASEAVVPTTEDLTFVLFKPAIIRSRRS